MIRRIITNTQNHQQAYARIPTLKITTPAGTHLEPDLLAWWTSGLRQEHLHPSGDPKLAWLHTDLKGISTRWTAGTSSSDAESTDGRLLAANSDPDRESSDGGEISAASDSD